jgi:hypothetical protein
LRDIDTNDARAVLGERFGDCACAAGVVEEFEGRGGGGGGVGGEGGEEGEVGLEGVGEVGEGAGVFGVVGWGFGAGGVLIGVSNGKGRRGL